MTERDHEGAPAAAAAPLEGDALRAENDALRAQLAAKDAFLARMSHELRSPLHVILGAVELLAPVVSGRDVATVTSIDSAARTLLALIEDLLDLSKIRAGSFSLSTRPFHLIALFEETIATIRTLSDAAGVDLVLVRRGVFPAYARGDAGRIRQIVTNLLSNAIKFARAGKVELRLTGWADALHVEVTDEGPGLGPDEERTIFEDFQQGALGKRRGGAGLGLAISRQLVTQMGGEMGYRPNPAGRGAAFWFEVPLEEATEEDWIAASRRSSMPAMPSAAKTSVLAPVLVVEDTAASRVWATRTLEARGFKVVAVDSGEAALLELGRGTFSVVLMDWHMAGMDGLATTRAIRALEGEMRLVPIIGLTASAQPGDREACVAAGMNECLFKPTSSRTLVRAVERLAKAGGPGVISPLPVFAPLPVIVGPLPSVPALAGDVTMLPKDVQRELSELFDRDGTDLLRGLEAAAANGDRAQALRSLHALQGLAGNLGMKALRALAQELEAALKAGEGVDAVVPKLPALERLRAEASLAFATVSGR